MYDLDLTLRFGGKLALLPLPCDTPDLDKRSTSVSLSQTVISLWSALAFSLAFSTSVQNSSSPSVLPLALPLALPKPSPRIARSTAS